MRDKKFLIHELAELAGTTVRTIRYYTEVGLLPQPEQQGKYSVYHWEHYERLELIRRMKNAYLPLREIRQVLLSLTASQVHQRFLEPVEEAQAPQQVEMITMAATGAYFDEDDNTNIEADGDADGSEDQPGGSPPALRQVAENEAQNYIARLLEKQTELRKPAAAQHATPPAPFAAPALSSPAKLFADVAQAPMPPQPNKPADLASHAFADTPKVPTSENWRRVRLAPGVELHFLEPQPSHLASRLEQLIVFAQKLFQ